jgi:hypothetical protein
MLLSFFVVIATITVVCGLAFFMICIMQWPIGPVEVIALIVFIGYAVTYSLHISHKFGADIENTVEMDGVPMHIRHDDWKVQVRYLRTRFAMKSIGGAALGSAITTVGCSIFLICCQLTIFQRLGGVILFISCLSIFTALTPLPAALLLAGPLSPGLSCIPCLSYAPPPERPDCLPHEYGSEPEARADDDQTWEVSASVARTGRTSEAIPPPEQDVDLHGGASRRKTAPVVRNKPRVSSLMPVVVYSLSSPDPVARRARE